MTNPNNAVGTNAAYAGRTSVNAFNDDLAAYSRGIISGWDCVPSSGLTVVLGGDGTTRDVAVAEDNAGNKTSINNISGAPVPITMSAAPGANSRIDLIVAYVDNPPQGSSAIADNYEACGLITVQGTAAANPVAPSDSAIRTAITSDGASGTTAYYVVLATVTLASGTTDIDSSMIADGNDAVSFGGGKHLYYKVFSSNSAAVSFMAQSDCIIKSTAITGYKWGYDGGTMSMGITASGATKIFGRDGGITGGNGVGRQMVALGVFSATAGSSVTITGSIGGGSGGTQAGSDYMLVEVFYGAKLN